MKRFQRLFHYLIIINLVTGFLSSLYMVFVVYKPPGNESLIGGPLWSAARTLPHDFIVERRLYALEAWIVFGFLSIYYALTSKGKN